MAKELVYRLTNPGYTIYHRAALGGLAATIRAWGHRRPEGIDANLCSDQIRLAWGDDLTDQEALRRILDASFKLTEDKLIDLPGQAIPEGQQDLRLAIHNGIVGTFLQHPKMRPGEKEPRRLEIRTDGDEAGQFLTYKAIDRYAHQSAQRTGLLEEKLKGRWPAIATLNQAIVPGALTGVAELDAPPEEIFLLLFLVVGCAIFLLRPRAHKEKAQYCVVVPDVINLEAFARDLQRIAAAGQSVRPFSSTYLGRVVGGAEEAALRFLIDIHAADIAEEPSVAGCLAVAMGKVAWDANQTNRSFIIRVRDDYPEIGIFRAANTHLSRSRIIRSQKGEGYAVATNPVPELIAANLAAERHWCANFRSLVSEKKEFERMRDAQGGLHAMKEAINDAEDQAVIRAFHDAWRLTMSGLYKRASREGLDASRLIEVEREKIRNAILRAKNSEALASWFLRFCAEATREGSLGSFRGEADRLRQFIFNRRNFDRFQNLCLFALVSYASDGGRATTEGAN